MIRLAADQALSLLAQRAKRVFVSTGAGEPLALLDAAREHPELTFVGAFLPGVNRSHWGRMEGTFVSRDWPDIAFRPLTYFQTWGWLGRTPLDAGLFHVSPPDADGMCSLGVATDLAPAVLARDVFKVAQVNPLMPVTQGPKVPLEAFDIVVEAESPLLEYDTGKLDPAFDTIAKIIAGLTPDGASVQFGIGKAGVAALAGLVGRKGIRVHSGMVTDPLLALEDVEVVTALALGTRALYDRCASDRRIRFEPVSFTHDIRTLAAIPRLVAVNSALEVDLFGQANAEVMGGRQISGVGGLTDFLRGARMSEGGVPIIALNATAKGASRIVPRVEAVSVPRADVGVVVTEYGAADLRGLTLDERAQALIAIAAPEHRDGLSNAWDGMR